MKISNDIILSIAMGRNRKELNWRNKEIKWSELLRKLSKTHRTAETYSEYMKSKKSRQDEIKDIGGFVGGYVANGKRKKENITFRSLIALDLDYANLDMFDEYKMLYGYAACVYSTHKHTLDKPRLRLIIPLKETIPSDQYEPVARKIAEWLGIDMFDDTTFESSRLMYWPSTCKDGEFYFDYCDGSLLDPKKVLDEYQDWTDISNWAMSSRVDKIMAKAIKKQESPLDKKGIIGTFCRAYSITEAIETFLSDIYTPCDIPNRYTYTEGSTSAGVIVYDDLFSYSHHGTDPTSGKLCNAYDLVRIHKFGGLDDGAKEDTPSPKLPSSVKMKEFMGENERVKKLLIEEKLSEVSEDFKDIDIQIKENKNDKWFGKLAINSNSNKIKSTIDNVVLILSNDPYLENAFAYNEFEKMIIVKRKLPWHKSNQGYYFNDSDECGLRHYLEKVYGVSGVQKIRDALEVNVRQNSFHPVKEYLNPLQWDGQKRLDNLLIDYLGAEDNEYTKTVTRKALVACVARIMNPGCKFDNVITFVGPQGIGKSTLLLKLGKEWYNESVSLFNISKETSDLIQGSWLIELSELVGFKKAESEGVKSFISRTEDKFRKAYGRNTEKFPRQCVFFGTTNEQTFLKDPTGNRRWWPVRANPAGVRKSVFKDLDGNQIDQIWAEAKHLYENGEKLYLNKDIYLKAVKVQELHNERNEKIGLIEDFLAKDIPENWEDMDIYAKRDFLKAQPNDARWKNIDLIPRNKVCVLAIWCELFEGNLGALSRIEARDIMNCMRQIEGWEECKSTIRFKNYGIQKGFKSVNQVKKLGLQGVGKSAKSQENGQKSVNQNCHL